MSWLTLISNLASRVPIERVLFPPRDNIKTLEKFEATLKAPVAENKAPPEQKTSPTITQEPEMASKESVATACVPCALGHFSTSAGLLNESVRFKEDGIDSIEIANRIAIVLKEQNALERVDLTPEKIRATPEWERGIAEEALKQSRSLRHRLETIETIGDLEQIAVDTEGYYRTLHGEWWRKRLSKLPAGTKLPPLVSEEDKEEIKKRAVKKIDEVLGSTPTEPQSPAVIPVAPRPRKETDLEYLADSPEFLAQTIDNTGYRPKLENAFQEAITRIKESR